MVLKALFTLASLGADVIVVMTMILAAAALIFFGWLIYQRTLRSTLVHVGLLTYARKRLAHQAYKHTSNIPVYILWVTPLIWLEELFPERKGQNANEFVY